jgi:hypothetical protein
MRKTANFNSIEKSNFYSAEKIFWFSKDNQGSPLTLILSRFD